MEGVAVLGLMETGCTDGFNEGELVMGIFELGDNVRTRDGRRDGSTDGATVGTILGANGLVDTGCTDGATEEETLGATVVDAKPVGFKHSPEF